MCLDEMVIPGPLFVNPEAWSKNMCIRAQDSQERVGNGTQMARYHAVTWGLPRC